MGTGQVVDLEGFEPSTFPMIIGTRSRQPAPSQPQRFLQIRSVLPGLDLSFPLPGLSPSLPGFNMHQSPGPQASGALHHSRIVLGKALCNVLSGADVVSVAFLASQNIDKKTRQAWVVDLEGFEPSTSSMPLRRAPNCATGPRRGRRGPGHRHSTIGPVAGQSRKGSDNDAG